jgi:hypothetical protein
MTEPAAAGQMICCQMTLLIKDRHHILAANGIKLSS